jgi:hypothetical protein
VVGGVDAPVGTQHVFQEMHESHDGLRRRRVGA